MKVKNSDNEKTPQYAKYVRFDNGVVRFVGDFVATRLSFLLGRMDDAYEDFKFGAVALVHVVELKLILVCPQVVEHVGVGAGVVGHLCRHDAPHGHVERLPVAPVGVDGGLLEEVAELSRVVGEPHLELLAALHAVLGIFHAHAAAARAHVGDVERSGAFVA